MNRMRLLVAGMALAAVAAPACAGRPPTSPSHASNGCSGHRSSADSWRIVARVSWPEKRLASGAPASSLSSLAVDPATKTAYELIARTKAPDRGPYELECVDLRNGAVHNGPTLTSTTHVSPSVTVAAGYLWLYGFSGHRARVVEANPRSMRLVRSIRLPGRSAPAVAGIRLAAGPAGSVWVGSVQTGAAIMLFRLDAHTGAVLATARLPARLAATGLAIDPSGRFLYASAAHIVSGGVEGNIILEYNATSGHRVAEATHGLVTDSVLGADLTAVPGGVWASFRTGMLGLTLHLRQQDLAMIAPTGPGFALPPSKSLFHWAMYATTSYGGGAMWFASQEGVVACLDPRTGSPIAEEHVSQSRLVFQLLAADPATRHLYAADAGGLVDIRPPSRCWSGGA